MPTPRKFCPPFRPMWRVLSPADQDGWSLQVFYLNKYNTRMEMVKGIYSGQGFEVRDLQPSHYVRLVTPQGEVMMSDTPMERRTNLPLVNKAHGQVLIAGLGIGMVLIPLLAKDAVWHITVLEKEPAIIAMVEPQLRNFLPAAQGDRLTVKQADVYTWAEHALGAGGGIGVPAYDTIYFDIWGEVEPVYRESRKLFKAYKPLLAKTKAAWMEAWRREDSRDMTGGN